MEVVHSDKSISLRYLTNYSCRFEQARIEYFFQYLPKRGKYELRTMEVIPRTTKYIVGSSKTAIPFAVRKSLTLPREIAPFSKRQAGRTKLFLN